MKFLQQPNLFVILFEGNIHSYRQIFLDRKEHPKELNPSWYGDSIGRWDGDTLVVDTVGFNDRTWFDFAGHPHTEQLHTIERFRRMDLGMIEYNVTIEDPGAYTKPFTLIGHFPLQQPGTGLMGLFAMKIIDVTHLVGFEPPSQRRPWRRERPIVRRTSCVRSWPPASKPTERRPRTGRSGLPSQGESFEASICG
jgi:hypothetical protein